MMKKCMGCMRDYEESYSKCPACGYSDAQAAAARKKVRCALKPGVILGGRYTLGRVLSCSDFSIVYIAWDTLLKKRAAVKEYFPVRLAKRVGEAEVRCGSARDQELFEKGMGYFEEEIRDFGMNQDIPEIVEIYRCIRENNTAYAVMEYMEGRTLRDWLDEGTISDRDAFLEEVRLNLERAVGQLHERGLQHCDLNPDNIYVGEDGTVRLLDFCSAKRKLQRIAGKGIISDMDRNEDKNSFQKIQNTRGLGIRLKRCRIKMWIFAALTIVFASACVFFAAGTCSLKRENDKLRAGTLQQETEEWSEGERSDTGESI